VARQHQVGAAADLVGARIDEEQLFLDAEPERRAGAEAMLERCVVGKSMGHLFLPWSGSAAR